MSGLFKSRARAAMLGATCTVAIFAAAPACNETVRSSSVEPPSRLELERARARTPAIVSIAITVSELEPAIAFFRDLEFDIAETRELSGSELDALLATRGATMAQASLTLGSEKLELRRCASPHGRPIPSEWTSNDDAFQHVAIVVSDMDRAWQRLQRLAVTPISPGPQTIPAWNAAAGGIRALYFRDRDRHNLEIIWFPHGKGDPRWQTAGSRLFLGIDHSAIAVRDSEQSATIYRALGLNEVGHSLNYGPEQAALSGVPGARVRITSFAPRRGPGVEFLSYLAPGAGRKAPTDTSACDLWHWEMTVRVPSVADALAGLRRLGFDDGAVQPVDVGSLGLGYRRAALVRDRDGHALRLVES